MEPSRPAAALVPVRIPIGTRLLYMIVFGLTFWLLLWILAVCVLAQLILTLLAGQPNPELLRFSEGFSRYLSQIINFITFVSEKPPFPFAPWPE